MQHRRLLSHADLLRCLQQYDIDGPEETAAWAQALGYAPQTTSPPSQTSTEPDTTPASTEPLLQVASTPATRPPLRLPRVVQYETLAPHPERLDEPAWYREASAWEEEDPGLSADPLAMPPPQLPLMPWSRLWPFLKTVLSRSLESAQLDVPPLVQRLARGEMPPRLPRRLYQRWAGTCQVLLDFADQLTPFWDDFHGLRQRLEPLRGVQGLTVLAFPDGDPEGRCLAWSASLQDWREGAGYTLPPADTPVLVLSDLGCNDATGVRRRPWRRLGLRLRRAGCQPVALMPCPARYWDGEVTQLFAPVYWDRGARRARRPRPQRGPAAAHAPQTREAAAVPLLQALGAAVRVEPALLRAVRYLLPNADVGSEAAAWNHPHMHATPLAMYYEPEEVAGYRQAFAQLDLGLRQEVAGLFQAYHAHLSPFIRHEEHWLMETSGSVPSAPDTEKSLARLVRNLATQEGNLRAAAQAWVERLARRQYAASWQEERLVALWVAAHLAQLQAGETLAVPNGLDIEKARWLLRGTGAPQHYVLRQRGTALYIETEPPASPLDAPGSLLGHISTARAFVRVQYSSGDDAERLHPLQQGLQLPPEGGVLLLRTEYQEVCIESQSRPAWASGMSQDQYGLGVTWATRQRRAYWVPPGVYAVTDRAGQALGQRHISPGFWCDAAEAVELLREGFRQPVWAEAYGLDAYGLYADWSAQGVTQRMRWIAPGMFTMGSPENEPERNDDETLHTVLLTRGFWLADTACTQALWQAVMQANPSDAGKGAEYPVDSISWNDVQTFLQRLNSIALTKDFRLPTEAEWEYACRAGSTTPFWFGGQITPEQVNYDGNYPYAGGKKGLYRAESVPVYALPCNAWGLYQMHGNVWEWCRDWYAQYAAVTSYTSAANQETAADIASVDPFGAAEGVYRVLRGGSWISDGRLARSAQRLAARPGDRFVNYGFRLARGQASTVERAPEAPVEPGARRAGQTQRSGGGQARRTPRQRRKK